MRTNDSRLKSQGGMVAVAALRLLAEYAQEHTGGLLRLTSRQSVVLPGLSAACLLRLRRQLPGECLVVGAGTPNPVTTAPVAGDGAGRGWLRPGVFADVLHAIGPPPPWRLGIVDRSQPYLPLPPSEVEVVAMPREDAWQLRLPRRGRAAVVAPGHLRTAHVGGALRRMADAGVEPGSCGEAALADLLEDLLQPGEVEKAEAPARHRTPPGALLLHEPVQGWNARHVQDLCLFAQQRGLPAFGLSPARALVLHGLGPADHDALDELHLRHRYAPMARAWAQWMTVEAGLESAADALADALQQRCPVNPGVALAVARPGAAACDGAWTVAPLGRRGLIRRRDWYRLEGGQTAEGELTAIVEVLLAVCASPPAAPEETAPAAVPVTDGLQGTRQCGECLSAYDPRYGDPHAAVPPGTPFDALPGSWNCPVCGAPGTAYHANERAA